jgi:hypothetical protein
MTATGPDFIALQARNVQAAAAGLAIQATKNLSALPIASCTGRGVFLAGGLLLGLRDV